MTVQLDVHCVPAALSTAQLACKTCAVDHNIVSGIDGFIVLCTTGCYA
jgi:hypothetical protein